MVAPSYQQPIAHRDPTDVLGRRIGAFFIDAAILVVVAFALFFAIAEQTTLSRALREDGCEVPAADRFKEPSELTTLDCGDNFAIVVDSATVLFVEGNTFATGLLAIGAGHLVITILLEGLVGGSLGKLMTGLRVVRKDTGQVQGIGRSVVRYLLFFVDGPFSFYLCGLITSIVSKGHRRVGDMVAGTLVVRSDAVGSPPLVPGLTAPAAYAAPAPGYGYGYGQTPPPPPGYGQPAQPGWPTPPPQGGPQAPPAWPQPQPQPPAATQPWGQAPPMAPPWGAPGQPVAGPQPVAPPVQPSDEPTSNPPPPASPTGAPAWDRAHGAWMQWDPARGAWMVWNPETSQWATR